MNLPCSYRDDGTPAVYPMAYAVHGCSNEIVALLKRYGGNLFHICDDGSCVYEHASKKVRDDVLISLNYVIGWTFIMLGNGWADIILPLIERLNK